jgi:hypothetical protein
VTDYGALDSEHLADDVVSLFGGERRELLYGDGTEAEQRLLGGPQCGIRLGVRIVVGPNQQDALALELTRDEMKKLEGRRVRPLKIFEQDEKRLFGRDPAEELGEVP